MPRTSNRSKNVDSLRAEHRGWMPHVAPMHGRVGAEDLSVLSDPRLATPDGVGSGFLCFENDAPAAERQLEIFGEVGIIPADITPWNGYPRYINAVPKGAQLDAGVEPLVALLDPHDEPAGGAPAARGRPQRVVPAGEALPGPGTQDRHGRRDVPPRVPSPVPPPDPDVRRSRVEHRAAAYRELAGVLGRG